MGGEGLRPVEEMPHRPPSVRSPRRGRSVVAGGHPALAARALHAAPGPGSLSGVAVRCFTDADRQDMRNAAEERAEAIAQSTLWERLSGLRIDPNRRS